VVEIKSCKYNNDNDTISIIKTNGSKVSILCTAVEDSLNTNITTRSKLEWLKDNEPFTYAELVITGKLQDFLDQYDESYYRQHDTIEKQLIEHFNGDKACAVAIAREIMMYGE
jgi:hypothetical protein